MSVFSKLKLSLTKTSRQIGALLASFTGADDDFFDDLEQSLILADVGARLSEEVVSLLREDVLRHGLRDAGEVKSALIDILTNKLLSGSQTSDNSGTDSSPGTGLKLNTKPSVILVIGVNGVGKTTTIGKLSAMLTGSGKKVLLCAADTFRAAAVTQLAIWAEHVNTDIIMPEQGSDPASVIFDGINAAVSRGCDALICDTAGRLHNKKNLMSELEKISRIIKQKLPGADIETLLVLDATTGQNGLIQAKHFTDIADVTGIILTKLDGTAKGGIVFSIVDELNIPVKFIGVGEGINDLLDFDPHEFSKAIIS